MGNTRIVGDFRFTTSMSGLRVECLDYHAEPQLLTYKVLSELGLAPLSGNNPEATDDSRLLIDH
jgi:hypothetical protein